VHGVELSKVSKVSTWYAQQLDGAYAGLSHGCNGYVICVTAEIYCFDASKADILLNMALDHSQSHLLSRSEC
jgi:hypothetical protein